MSLAVHHAGGRFYKNCWLKGTPTTIEGNGIFTTGQQSCQIPMGGIFELIAKLSRNHEWQHMESKTFSVLEENKCQNNLVLQPILYYLKKKNRTPVDNVSMFMRVQWFLNGQYKTVIPEHFFGKIIYLHTWWGNHGLMLDLDNDNLFEYTNNDSGYSPCDNPSTCVDAGEKDFSFFNGFSLQNYHLWYDYWYDSTHGKIKCWASDCSYNPYGAGATFQINSRDFKCDNNIWKHLGNSVLDQANNEIYCRQFNTCGDGVSAGAMKSVTTSIAWMAMVAILTARLNKQGKMSYCGSPLTH